MSELRRLLAKHGRLSAKIINTESSQGKCRALANRFGSFLNACRAAGFDAPINVAALDRMRSGMLQTRCFLRELVQHATQQELAVRRTGSSCQVEFAAKINVRLIVARQSSRRTELREWRDRSADPRPDFFVVYRLAGDGTTIEQHYLFPSADLPARPDGLCRPSSEPFFLAGLDAVVAAIARECGAR